MVKELKLYKVTFGYLDKNGDSPNWDAKNVMATDVLEATKKVTLRKREYVAEVEIIAGVDIR